MKRTNVVLDEKLLERARKVLGEKTYSATITKALEKVVRQADFWAAYDELKELAKEGPIFDPQWLAENYPQSAEKPRKRRVSADEHRLSRKRN
ncbi:MAG TPA: type II toxin-antitoxin system VapB family antitoxin [Thermoanaerobaculia bacterium]|nr:type II toxin-antitoxin system VapB family antitoxin [Thermoanaerobaculia bacterium]